MPDGDPEHLSDSRRDALRYSLLVSELREASNALRPGPQKEPDSAEEALERLLPRLSDALNGQRAFLAELALGDIAPEPFIRVSAVHPADPGLLGSHLPMSPLFQKLMRRQRAVVVDNLKDENRQPIPGLELFRATSAVVVRMEMAGRMRFIGVCNRRQAYLGPFLAADRMILESLTDLVTFGIELGERRKQELENILKTSLGITVERAREELLEMIADSAGQAFNAPVSVMLWNETGDALEIRAAVGLSDAYMRDQRIPKAKVDEVLAQMGEGALSWQTENLPKGAHGARKLVAREGLQTVLSTKMVVRNRLVGALNIYSRESGHVFGKRERELAEIFASQAAQGMYNASLYARLETKNRHMEQVNKASKLIVKHVGQGREALMYGILTEAVETVTSAIGEKARVGVLLLRHERSLLFESIYPKEIVPTLRMPEGRALPLDPPPGKPAGISVRAFHKAQAVRVGDVLKEPDYVPFCGDTRSELAVPLLENGRPIGVLNVESDAWNAFDEDDVEALEALADLAVIALRTAEQAEQLSRANSVAIMGAWGADVAHDINREVGNLRRAIRRLRMIDGLGEEAKTHITRIDEAAAELRLPELPADTNGQGTVRRMQNGTCVDYIAVRSIRRLQEKNPDVPILFEGGCPGVMVLMDEEWIRRILRHLIGNAVRECMRGDLLLQPRVTVRTALEGGVVVVQVEDTGPGVPPHLADVLFRKPVPAGGLGGRGLLLVQFLVENYGGKIHLHSNHPGEGACFAFTLKTLDAEEAQGV